MRRVPAALTLAGATWLLALISQTYGRSLQYAPASEAVKADSRSEDVPEEPRWIARMFARELGEDSSALSNLCFQSHKDLGREIHGSLQPGPPPSGGGFSMEDLRDFPYATEGYCKSLFDYSLKLETHDCELRDFEPLELLEQIRGHRLIFWGDSVMRQYFSYVSLRLSRHELDGQDTAGHSGQIPLADPERCMEYNKTDRATGLSIDQACFDLPPGNLEENCLHYLDGETSICYVRAERTLLDARNVVYWNALQETDIVMMNMGLHHNTRSGIRKELRAFTQAVHYYQVNYRKLPLMIWRETSAQHFEGGEGGNYPIDPSLKEVLRHVDEDTFECTDHTYKEMAHSNFRNSIVQEHGFTSEGLRVVIPILRVWNVTAMASDLHPRTLEHKTREDREGFIADCTHFCPTFGGMYEVWATLLQNFLVAAQPLQDNLRPMLLRDVMPQPEPADPYPTVLPSTGFLDEI